jgi:hypothetical protein
MEEIHHIMIAHGFVLVTTHPLKHIHSLNLESMQFRVQLAFKTKNT